jgi:pyridoxal phosphate enzyme (YggS family)
MIRVVLPGRLETMSIASSLALVREEIAVACGRAGRAVDEITLVAVSKTFPAAAVREAHAAGVRHVGENRVQELLAKKPALDDLELTWHLIGSLQTNKVRVLPHLGLLHSLDRIGLAEAIAREAPKLSPGRLVPALIQVNTTGETTKSGTTPGALDPLVDRVRALGAIELRGLMTIGPLGGSEDEIRRAFSGLRGLRDHLRRAHPDLGWPVLSMGMSDDFPLAIAEGATHLRIGSRIFGARARALSSP